MKGPWRPPSWPEGARAALSLTFDVDVESSWIVRHADFARRLTLASEVRYGAGRGLERLLTLLAELRCRGTFFVPGDTADRFPHVLDAILAGGHELGHHGHMHVKPLGASPQCQREEIERGLASLARAGVRPAGYRAPFWSLTPETLALLIEHDFRYDSSLMEDDRPYRIRYGDAELLELPPHWSLDDAAYFWFDGEAGGNVASPDTVRRTWTAELDEARRDGGHIILTMHPDIIGRGARAAMLRELVEHAHALGDVWIATLADVAHHVATEVGPKPTAR
jgi:peptidoglycan/xylan/chitin deacetylase (PgdA/CDA1 family)